MKFTFFKKTINFFKIAFWNEALQEVNRRIEEGEEDLELTKRFLSFKLYKLKKNI